MEKRIGLQRKDGDAAYICQICEFWTNLGWEVICPPPNTGCNPIVKLWCGSGISEGAITLRIRRGRIYWKDLLEAGRQTGEPLRNLAAAARRCKRP